MIDTLASKQSSYDTLQVSASASADDIRQAFLDLVRVWHPDRFASDPRLQKIAEEKLKGITEAYEVLSGVKPEGAPETPPVPISSELRIRPSGFGSGLWLKALGFSVLFLGLWFVAGPLLSALVAPIEDHNFTDQEALRIARLFGPDPAIAEDGSEGFGALRARASGRADRKAHRDPRPANGADLTPPRSAGGLGELYVRNESDVDCVLRLVIRDSPGLPLRVVYVRAGQEAAIYGLRPDIYRLRVAFGRELNSSSLGFLQSEADDYWVGPFEFFQVQSSKSRHGVRYNVALKPPASASAF